MVDPSSKFCMVGLGGGWLGAWLGACPVGCDNDFSMTLIISSLTVMVSFELAAAAAEAGEPAGKVATWLPAGPKGAARGRAMGGQCLRTAALSKCP